MAIQSENQVDRLSSSESLSIQTHEFNNRKYETVDARKLHSFLGAGRDFSNWIKARIKQYEFAEGLDFLIVEDLSSPNLASSKSRAQKVKNYFITLDMAKELAMVERNDKGREARRYFIECEHKLRSNQVPAIEHDTSDKTLPSIQSQYITLEERAKYKLLNGIIKSMEFKQDTLVIPAIEMAHMVNAVRTCQEKLAFIAQQATSPNWIDEQIDTIKTYTNRNLAD